MRVFLSIKYFEDQRNRQQIEKISAALANHGLDCFCVVREIEQWGAVRLLPDELMRRTLAVLRASDLLLVDLAEKGVGVGIEAGYAHACGIPVVTMAPVGVEISNTLRGISAACFTLNDWGDLDKVAEWLSSKVFQRHR